MVKSMTGFGKSTLSKEKREYQMEIKSVNHRYLDITIKMPKTLSYLEDEIKKEISSKIKRGKVDVFITFENNSDREAIKCFLFKANIGCFDCDFKLCSSKELLCISEGHHYRAYISTQKGS